jgi:hypothetical protein
VGWTPVRNGLPGERRQRCPLSAKASRSSGPRPSFHMTWRPGLAAQTVIGVGIGIGMSFGHRRRLLILDSDSDSVWKGGLRPSGPNNKHPNDAVHRLSLSQRTSLVLAKGIEANPVLRELSADDRWPQIKDFQWFSRHHPICVHLRHLWIPSFAFATIIRRRTARWKSVRAVASVARRAERRPHRRSARCTRARHPWWDRSQAARTTGICRGTARRAYQSLAC